HGAPLPSYAAQRSVFGGDDVGRAPGLHLVEERSGERVPAKPEEVLEGGLAVPSGKNLPELPAFAGFEEYCLHGPLRWPQVGRVVLVARVERLLFDLRP